MFKSQRTSAAADAVQVGVALHVKALALYRRALLVERRRVLANGRLAVRLPARHGCQQGTGKSVAKKMLLVSKWCVRATMRPLRDDELPEKLVSLIDPELHARRKRCGNPPPPMTPAEAAKIGRERIAANIEEVVAKRKQTRGY